MMVQDGIIKLSVLGMKRCYLDAFVDVHSCTYGFEFAVL